MILEKGIWFGAAAIGFGVLFNVPSRTIFLIWVLAALGGITKLFLLKMGISVILASFGGATLIGILSIPFAHNKHTPRWCYPFLRLSLWFRASLHTVQ